MEDKFEEILVDEYNSNYNNKNNLTKLYYFRDERNKKYYIQNFKIHYL